MFRWMGFFKMQHFLDRARTQLTFVFILLFCVPPFVTRIMLMYNRGLGLSWIDLRGILLDLMVATIFALLAIWLLKVHRILAMLVGLIWLVICFAGYEVAQNFDALNVLGYAGYLLDATFLFGSAVHIGHWAEMLATFIIVLGGIWLLGSPPIRQRPLRALPIMGIFGIGFLGLILVPENGSFAAWRQSNLVVANVFDINFAGLPFEIDESQEAAQKLAKEFAPDLAGKRVIASAQRDNILLIVLESVSGAYLPSLARQHGINYQVAMPKLDARALREVSYRTFVSQQRQTNRGQYAILCGDYPKLSSDTARMTEFAVKATRRCLPELLREEGYHAAYMQAAPLAFMMKDAFMENIGFDEVVGFQSFDKAYSRSNWGVDDRAFLEGSLNKIRSLAQQKSPWFVTLLTAGTHHPINVPDSFHPPGLETEQQRAFAWLDLGLEDLLNTLEAEGILKNTLVVITNDESAGMLYGANARARVHSQNWGFAMLQTPDSDNIEMMEPFAQSDIALSILDYLDLTKKAPHFVGRSMIRTYESERNIYFSNTYMRRTGMLTSSGLELSCTEDLKNCQAWEHEDGAVFSAARSGVGLPKEPWQELANTVQRSGSVQARAKPLVDFSQPLVKSAIYTIPPLQRVTLFGGQYLTISSDSQMSVELSFELMPGSAFGTFKQDAVIAGSDKLGVNFQLGEMHGGDKATLKYTRDFASAQEKVEVRFSAINLSNEPLSVRVNAAHLSLKPKTVQRDNVEVIENSILRAGVAAQP